MSSNIKWFADIGLADLEQVGGKNSSLGEFLTPSWSRWAVRTRVWAR